MNKEKKSDLTLKIFALLIAILLWAYVMDEVNPEIIREYKNIDLEFSNVESLDKAGLKLMSPQESKVSVKIAGKKNDIDRFDRYSGKRIKAIVDLSGYTEGQIKVPVKVSLESEMTNIEIVDYEPKEVMITFDKFITTEKKITVRTLGELPDSYVLGDIKIRPETVLLKGPRSYMKEISDVVTYIDLTGMKKSGKTNTQIRILNDQGNDLVGIEKESKSVDAEITILRSKEVKINPVFNGELPGDYNKDSIIINPGKIKLKGDERVLELASINTATINIDELLAKKTVKVDVKLPEGVEKLDPKELVTISLNEKLPIEKMLTISSKDIEIQNLGKDLVISSGLSQDINLIVKGENIEKLDKNDIKLFINLENLEEGSHDVKIGIKLPQGLELVNMSPDSLSIKISK